MLKSLSKLKYFDFGPDEVENRKKITRGISCPEERERGVGYKQRPSGHEIRYITHLR